MTAISQTLGEAALLVARATDSMSGPSPTTSASVQSPQSSSPAGTNQSNDDPNNQSGGGGSSSPLLFFVALGFGVVFTNLWIIVGVKYCFRYNARNRARLNNEDGEPITLETVQRPHRRRREKKLMSMDEVNNKFPMIKYKTWVSERAREGLPTAGGVSISASRANSIREADGIVPVLSAKDPASVESDVAAKPEAPATAGAAGAAEVGGDAEKTKTETDHAAGKTSVTKDALQRMPSDDDVDDEHIDAALPPEFLGAPGDTCAICIDSLEDDEDVRRLSCGHAFHAVCLDPWLTSRRACCPLCKADYYTPKPRPHPEGESTPTVNNTTIDGRRNPRVNLPGRLPVAWLRGGGADASRYPVHANPRSRRANRARNIAQGRLGSAEVAWHRQQTEHGAAAQRPGRGLVSSVRQALRFGRRPDGQNGSRGNSDAPGNGQVTPSQLEAGSQTPAVARVAAQ